MGVGGWVPGMLEEGKKNLSLVRLQETGETMVEGQNLEDLFESRVYGNLETIITLCSAPSRPTTPYFSRKAGCGGKQGVGRKSTNMNKC